MCLEKRKDWGFFCKVHNDDRTTNVLFCNIFLHPVHHSRPRNQRPKFWWEHVQKWASKISPFLLHFAFEKMQFQNFGCVWLSRPTLVTKFKGVLTNGIFVWIFNSYVLVLMEIPNIKKSRLMWWKLNKGMYVREISILGNSKFLTYNFVLKPQKCKFLTYPVSVEERKSTKAWQNLFRFLHQKITMQERKGQSTI